MKKFLRIDDVRGITGFRSNSSIYQRMRAGLWTKPIHISGRASVWPEDEVAALTNAALAGYSEDDTRELVAKLHEQRAAFAA